LRESSGYSRQSLAKHLDQPESVIREVEEGKRKIGFREIRKLARLYKRPLTIFFTDKIPEIPVIRDYRINRDEKFSPKVFLAERRAYYMSTKISEIVGYKSKIPDLSQIRSFPKLAHEFRNYLLRSEDFEKVKPRNKLLSWYKGLLEDKLRIIVMEYELDSDDVRAFSMQNDISIIVLNQKDKPAVKLFSLFHETCHLLRKQSGICSANLEKEQQESVSERFCELFAAEFLIPPLDLDQRLLEYSKPISYENFKKLSSFYGVSKQVMRITLSQRQLVPQPQSQDFVDKIAEDDASESARRTGGGRNWYGTYRNRVGSLALKEIETAYREGRISYTDALDYSGLTSKYARELMGL
jgi:Zn-dependent peptidase ImmA (M78 family)